MTALNIVLVSGLLLLALLSVWLYLSLRRANKKLKQVRRGNQPGPTPATVDRAAFVGPLIRDQDPLGNLLRFMHHHEQGIATVKQGYEACELLLDTLARSWSLKPTERYQSVVQFDPERHRLSANVRATKGQRVVVVEPGWTLVNEPIKYALVKVTD